MNENVFINTVNLLEKDINRAGVIPYTYYKNKLYFLCGIDNKTRDLCDFGGGFKKNENVFITAIRELNEESCEILGRVVSPNNLINSIALYYKKNVLFFLYIPDTWLNDAERLFYYSKFKLRGIKKYNELIGIKWVNEDDFMDIIYNNNNRCFWSKIKKTISNSINWDKLKIALLLDTRLNYNFYNDINNKFNRKRIYI